MAGRKTWGDPAEWQSRHVDYGTCRLGGRWLRRDDKGEVEFGE